jgi:hypothetical protein
MLFLAVASAVAQPRDIPPVLKFGAKAPDFTLPNPVDGKTYSLKDFDYAKVLVIVFTCNHCPMYEGRIKQIAADYRDKGVALVAIQPNGPIGYSERSHDDLGDSPEEMKIRAEYRDFNSLICMMARLRPWPASTVRSPRLTSTSSINSASCAYTGPLLSG